ncbi:hypothetical protein [Paenibacillus donghaensis]|uniref:Uncharacterized protein n=1 Tax=Paenibacillus donghaensis TaxID=414771 RepID=A0A2Z2KRH9_9BACL|nr:hypothetical protein [Paenibacillus donghaensis]ASA25429.1 hypothetical protein B9T62_34675 [Paenibacillus donghaensis]
MAIIRNKLSIEIEPTVPEVCAVISAVMAYYPGQEVKVLEGIRESLSKRIAEINSLEPSGDSDKEVEA